MILWCFDGIKVTLPPPSPQQQQQQQQQVGEAARGEAAAAAAEEDVFDASGMNEAKFGELGRSQPEVGQWVV